MRAPTSTRTGSSTFAISRLCRNNLRPALGVNSQARYSHHCKLKET
jgi:hypothetical protein